MSKPTARQPLLTLTLTLALTPALALGGCAASTPECEAPDAGSAAADGGPGCDEEPGQAGADDDTFSAGHVFDHVEDVVR